jgi:nickel transport protein
MRMYRRITASLAFQLLLIVTAVVQAHDYWFERSDEDYLLRRGHQHSLHAGERDVPFDPQTVKHGYCLRLGEARPHSATLSASYPLRVAGPCLALVVTVDAGNWTQTRSGVKRLGEDELAGVLRSWQALESVKWIEAWYESLRRPLSSELELVFTENPLVLTPGDKLRLRAMLRGEPAEGVTVAYDGDARGVTGADGRINLRIRHRGWQLITASLVEPLAREQVDKVVHSTTLSFELGD